MSMLDLFDPLSPIDLADPIARHHPLNWGRQAWLLVVPGLDGGRTWHDLVGSNHGTLTNMTAAGSGWRPTARPGGFGELALADAGTVRCAAAPAFDIAASGFTIAASFVITDGVITLGFSQVLLSKTNSGSSPFFSYEIRCGSSPTNSIDTIITYGSTNSVLNTGTISRFAWYRILLTCDGVTARLYLNGTPVASTSVSGSPYNGSGAFWIGDDSQFSGRNWPGSIDDVSTWNRPFSDQDAYDEFAQSRRGYPGALNRVNRLSFAAVSGSPTFGRVLGPSKIVSLAGGLVSS